MGFGLKLEDLSKFKLKKTGKGLGSDDQNTTTSESKPNFSIPKVCIHLFWLFFCETVTF